MAIAGTKYYVRPGNVLPSSGQSFSSYWMLIAGMTIFMFVLYVAANGQLKGWLNLLIYSTPSTVQPSGSSGTTSAPEVVGGASINQSGLISAFGSGSLSNVLGAAAVPGMLTGIKGGP